MAREFNRLTPLKVTRLKIRGMHADGGGLYLQVSRYDTKSWIFRYTLEGQQHDMGMGPLHSITLAAAREKATAYRAMLVEGIDPIQARNATRNARMSEAARAMSFAECARRYIASHRAGWKNPKHAEQWVNTLATYAESVFGELPVQAVDTTLVMKAIEPLWIVKPETASRLRGRIESVLDWAKIRELRTGDNPARWRGHLDQLLPARGKVRAVEHHAALAYQKIGDFMAALREQGGTAARALEFAILTAARTGEVIGATWNEIDVTAKVWTVPPQRMKAEKEHKVPLSARVLEVIGRQQTMRESDFVFPSTRAGKPLSNMAMAELLKRMGHGNVTVHGFRSSFRDWASEQTNYPREVCEMALAHAVDSKVEAAYRRGDLFEKRRRLMNDWEKYCRMALGQPLATPAGKVIPIHA